MTQLVYEVTFKGAASAALRAAFGDCEVSTAHGITTLRAELLDRAALHGLLSRVDALGLEVLEVKLLAEPPPTTDLDDWS